MKAFTKRASAKRTNSAIEEPPVELKTLLKRIAKPPPPSVLGHFHQPVARLKDPVQYAPPPQEGSNHEKEATKKNFLPMYSAVWRNSNNGKQMESVVALMPTGTANNVTFDVVKEKGLSFLKTTICIPGAFANPEDLWIKNETDKIVDNDTTKATGEETIKDLRNSILKMDALQGVVEKQRGIESYLTFVGFYQLKIDAMQDIISYQFKEGRSGNNECVNLAILDIEANEKTTCNKKKTKVEFF